MKFFLDGIWVYFPYHYIYPEQYEYMLHLKRTLDLRGPGALEMPTGTGKTVSLLSLILSWILARRRGMTPRQCTFESLPLHYYSNTPGYNKEGDEMMTNKDFNHEEKADQGARVPLTHFKLIYCCRTLGEIEKTMSELKLVWANIEYHMTMDMEAKNTDKTDSTPSSQIEPNATSPPPPMVSDKSKSSLLYQGSQTKLFALCLSSRKRMCLNPSVNQLETRIQVDSKCHDLTSSSNRQKLLSHSPSNLCKSEEGTKGKQHSLGMRDQYPNINPGLCMYYEGFEAKGKDMLLTGIYSFDDLDQLGKEQKICPYFLCRRLLPLADVIVYSYQYLLNPRISSMVSQQLRSDAIVVFDEAHNIDNVCVEALTVRINRATVRKARANIRKLSSLAQKMEVEDVSRLQQEYQSLVRGLKRISANKANLSSGKGKSNQAIHSSSLLSTTSSYRDGFDNQDQTNGNHRISQEGEVQESKDQGSDGNLQLIPLQTIPDSSFNSTVDQVHGDPFPLLQSITLHQSNVPNYLADIKSFISILKKLLGYLQSRLRQKQVIQESVELFLSGMSEWIGTSASNEVDTDDVSLDLANSSTSLSKMANTSDRYQIPHSSTSYLRGGHSKISLQHCTRRLQSLLNVLDLTQLDQFSPLNTICDLVSIASAYVKEGFVVLMEPWDEKMPTISNPHLQLACLDASICMKSTLAKFPRVILTSGTLSPITMLPRIIGMTPITSISLNMSLNRPLVCPLVVTRGEDQTTLSTKFQSRTQPDVVRNYGSLLLSLAEIVPDGIVGFFPSYQYLETVVSMWNEMGMLHRLVKIKLLFVETDNFLETQVALSNYRQASSSGRGAVFLSVARGKVSEGVDFDHHYGRCVILFGIPYLYTESHLLRAKLAFIRDEHQIREGEYLTFDAIRMAAQCVGRVIRGKSDYGVMIFADYRYARIDKRSKLPSWITQFMNAHQLNLSTAEAVQITRQFFKEMAQPLDRISQIGISLWDLDKIREQATSKESLYTNYS